MASKGRSRRKRKIPHSGYDNFILSSTSRRTHQIHSKLLTSNNEDLVKLMDEIKRMEEFLL